MAWRAAKGTRFETRSGFIQRDIFPSGMPPRRSAMAREINAAGLELISRQRLTLASQQ
ncbi:MAG TPA: hypothetical protein VIQ29_12010 [Ancylobacter sp.]